MDDPQEPQKANLPPEEKRPIIKFSGEVDFPALKGSWPNVRKVAKSLFGLASEKIEATRQDVKIASTLRELEAKKRAHQIESEIDEISKQLGDSSYLKHLLHDLSKGHENKRQIFIESLADLEAGGVTVQDQNKQSADISQDWIDHFGGEAEKISDPRAQTYFAKLLSAEIRAPGSILKRSVSVLAEIGPEEAVLFQKLCDMSFYVVDGTTGSRAGGPIMVITDGFGTASNNGLREFGLGFDQLSQLIESRLLVADLNTHISFGPINVHGALFGIGMDMIQIQKMKLDAAPLQKFNGPLFSRTGQDLHRIVSLARNELYRQRLFEHWNQLGYQAMPMTRVVSTTQN
jgi:Protein of unknown function (DUF2806)